MATEIYMLTDYSEGFADTIAFLGRSGEREGREREREREARERRERGKRLRAPRAPQSANTLGCIVGARSSRLRESERGGREM